MPVLYNAVRVAVVGSAFAQDVVNVFNVGGSTDSVVSIAESVGVAYADNFKSVLSSAYNFGYASGIDMSLANGDIGRFDLASEEQGGAPATPEAGLTAVINWTDSATGRGIRPGRTFLGPLSGFAFVDGSGGLLIGTSFAAGLANAAEAFMADVNAATGGDLSIVHGRGSTTLVSPIVAASVSPRSGHLDTRRR